MDISKVTLDIDSLLGSSATKIGHLAQAQGCLIYPSGNFIIFYSPILDEQLAYITHNSQFISSLEVSPDEKLLAVCESTKHGCATVYRIDDLESLKGGLLGSVWTLRGHKLGIDHLAFSAFNRYIVSLSNQDGSMFLWQSGEATTKNRLSKGISKVLFDGKGDLLTAGKGYLKVWPFHDGCVLKKMENQQPMLEGRVLAFGKKFSTQDFIDARIIAKLGLSEKLVLLSSQGLLCILSPGYEKIEKWIDVMMQGVSALELMDSVVICCGDHALVKAVDLEVLEFKAKFPKPPPTNRQNLTEDQPLECLENDEFPRCLGAKRVGHFVVTLYANRSMFIWRLEQLSDIQAVRSILSHRAKVNSLAILEQVGGGELVFLASAAQDHTLRLWHYYGKDGKADVGKVLGLKRNIYCKYLTHIIYTHSEHPITQIRPMQTAKIACIARNELIIYSIQNFSLFLLEDFEERLTALETHGELIILGTQHKKVAIYQLREDKIQKKREIQVEYGIEKLLVGANRILVNGKANTKIYSLQGELLKSMGGCEKIGVRGNYLLSCSNKTLTIANLAKPSRASSVSLNHEMEGDQLIQLIKSNSWLIVLITSKNRLILLNFSATVLYSELLHQHVTDLELTEAGRVFLAAQSGVLIVKNQSATGKFRQIDQKVKKWFDNNDMSWMDGSVWASKNKSHSNSHQISQQLQSKEKPKISQELAASEESIRLGEGSWADLSVSLKQPEAFKGAFSYKNEENKRSIFNPSSIVAQVNKIYKEVDQLQKGDKQKSSLPKPQPHEEGSSVLEQKSQLATSRGKRRIFGSKEHEEYQPQFTNNLVESCINEPEKLTNQTQEQPIASRHQQSVDFQLSNCEEPSKISEGPSLQFTRTKNPQPQFLESIKNLLLLSQQPNDYENVASIVCEHSQQYYNLYKLLDRVFEGKGRERREGLLRRMDEMWRQMRRAVQKEF